MNNREIPEADELVKVIVDTLEAVKAGQPLDEEAVFILLANSAARMILLSGQVKVSDLLIQVQENEIKKLKGQK